MPEEKNVSPMIEKIQELEKEIQILKEMYKADMEVAREIIYSGARQSERIKKLEQENDHYCGAITLLEKQIPDIKYEIHSSKEEINARLEKLEGKMKINICERCLGTGKYYVDVVVPQDFSVNEIPMKKGEVITLTKKCDWCEKGK